MIDWDEVARRNRLAALVLLWLPFSLFAVLGIILSLVAVLLARFEDMDRLLRAMDRQMAAVLGFSGLNTVSAEMGRMLFGGGQHARWKLWFCRQLDGLLSRFDPRPGSHCRIEAVSEGLLAE